MTRRDWNAEFDKHIRPTMAYISTPEYASQLPMEPFIPDGPDLPRYIAPKPRREWRWLRFPPPLEVTPELAVFVALVVVLAALLLRALACCVAW